MENTHPLLRSQYNWNLQNFEEPYNTYKIRRNVDLNELSRDSYYLYHDENVTFVDLIAPVVKAVIEYCKKEDSTIALVEVGDGTYSSEMQFPDGNTAIFKVAKNGISSGAMIDALGNYHSLPTLGDKKNTLDTSFIFLPLIMQLQAIEAEEGMSVVGDLLYRCEQDMNTIGFIQADNLYTICDAMKNTLLRDRIKCKMNGGVIQLATKNQVEIWENFSGKIIVGQPHIILKPISVSDKTGEILCFSEAKKQFNISKNDWSEEERKLIPTFPEDYPVPTETLLFCRRYLNSHNDKKPMLNFMWRGVTSYGKSTGVELMAAILDRPLLRMTCSSTMETQDFLSEILPNEETFSGKLPSYEDIAYFPEEAYHMLTGKEPEKEISSAEVYQMVLEAARSQAQNTPLYKHVKSNFVKALENGYIIEIQECSRIKDSGVLVSLNEYDRPGARIPLSNGTFTKRHPDAIVIYTDNVNYHSCRPLDQSVIRRMDFIKDSYEISKETVLSRVVYNTGFEQEKLLEELYKMWERVKDYCEEQDITDGAVSVTELEKWAQAVKMDGYSNVKENFLDCVVSKATSNREEQQDIFDEIY